MRGLKKLPKGLYEKSKAIIEELCEWCGKSDSKDCSKCCFFKALILIDIRKPKVLGRPKEQQEITSKDVGSVSDILNPI